MVRRSDEWLSTGESAQYLGITPRTLYRLIDRGDLPAYRFGRVIRLRAGDVEDYVESARVQPGELRHLYPDGNPSADPDDEDPGDEGPDAV
jgi:excisionase family DNA binding protein